MSIISQALERKQPDEPTPPPPFATDEAPPIDPATEAPLEGSPAPQPAAPPRQQSTFELLQGLKPYQRASSQPTAPLPPGPAIRRPARFQSGVFVGGLLAVAIAGGYFFIEGRPPASDPAQPPSAVEHATGVAAVAAPVEPAPQAAAPPAPAPAPAAAPVAEPTPMVLRVQLQLEPSFSGGGIQPQVVIAPATIQPVQDEPSGGDIPPPPKAPPRPIVASRALVEEYQLGGVSWKDSNPMAIINDEIVRVGEKIGEATVKEIQKDVVVIEVRGKRIELR